jgi:hypothetical protein
MPFLFGKGASSALFFYIFNEYIRGYRTRKNVVMPGDHIFAESLESFRMVKKPLHHVIARIY